MEMEQILGSDCMLSTLALPYLMKAQKHIVLKAVIHCLAILKEPESYNSLVKCLSDIVKEVERLTSITIGDKTFEVEYYLGGGIGSFWLLPLVLIALHLPMPASGASAQLLRGTVQLVNGQSVTLSMGLGQQKRTFVSSSHERNNTMFLTSHFSQRSLLCEL